jgi:hypothetical protein
MNERRRENEDSKGKYSRCTFYTSINMEHSKLLKPSQKEKYGRKENNGWVRPIGVIMHICIHIYIWKCQNEIICRSIINKNVFF